MRTFFAIPLLLAVPAIAHADYIDVTTTSDIVALDGTCSLREALITFNSEVAYADCPTTSDSTTYIQLHSGRYILTGGSLPIATHLQVAGDGLDETTIDASGTDRAFDCQSNIDSFIVTKLNIIGGTGDGGVLRCTSQEVKFTSSAITHTHSTGSIIHAKGLLMVDTQVLGSTATGALIDTDTVEVDYSTFVGNDAQSLISGVRSFRVAISTLTGNSANQLFHGTSTIGSSGSTTIADNQARVAVGFTSFTLDHSIVSRNTACTFAMTSAGNNLLADDAAMACFRPTLNDIVNVDPALAPLAYYGGPTPTMRPRPSSPARDRYNCFGGWDQRGVTRPVNGFCDLGAVEAAPELFGLAVEPVGPTCARGGFAIIRGEDRRGDTKLSDDEAWSRVVTCSTAISLVAVEAEPAGARCANGGQRVNVGVDSDGDGELSGIEVASSALACFDRVTLVATSDEPAGAACSAGGTRLDAGRDLDGDGLLSQFEIGSTAYLCNPETPLQVAGTEPGGEHCPAGGVRIDSGLDANGDGVLDASEITSTTYLCGTPAELVTVTPEPAGEHCEAGGQRIATGVDADGDGTLAPTEEAQASYACDEPAADGGCNTGTGTSSFGVALLLVVASLAMSRRAQLAAHKCK